MKYLKLSMRLTLGLALIIFGLNGFFHFFSTPAPSPSAQALLGALAQTGYFFPFVKAVEVISGLLLISGFFVPFGLALIFPILVGIVQIHLFLDPAGLVPGLVLLGIHIFLTVQYWENFKSVMTANA